MRTILILLIAVTGLACNRKGPDFDAMGHFEAEEQTIVAETSGRIISLRPMEGQRLSSGDTVAITDTASVVLQINQLKAQMNALRSRLPGIRAQVGVLETEMAILDNERDRFARLVSDQAASGKSLDDILNQLTLAKARKETFRSQVASITAEMAVLEAQEAQLLDQKRRCLILSPATGVVIDLIARQADMMTPGKPILKMADIDTIILKAYISGDQLSSVEPGQKVHVRIDAPGGDFYHYEGVVYWISSQSEFTPKVIQTKKERVNLVYAVKVRVPNDGKIKIGMPGEMLLNHE